jgi:hypothetical protein
VRWTLGADEKISILSTAGLGNAVPANTMPLPDSAGNPGTHDRRSQNIVNHEGEVRRQIICLTKSQVPALVYLDQFVYLGFLKMRRNI